MHLTIAIRYRNCVKLRLLAKRSHARVQTIFDQDTLIICLLAFIVPPSFILASSRGCSDGFVASHIFNCVFPGRRSFGGAHHVLLRPLVCLCRPACYCSGSGRPRLLCSSPATAINSVSTNHSNGRFVWGGSWPHNR
jgi:hypothetical protein